MPNNGGTNYAVTITTSPSLIRTHDPMGAWRKALSIANMSDVVVYLGRTSDVDISTGFPLEAGEKRSETGYCGYVYGVVETGSAELRVDVY